MKFNLSVALIFGSLFVVGCTTAPKITPQAESYYNQHRASITTPTAVVTDACLIRSEVGTSHVVMESSEILSKQLATALSSALNEAGVQTKTILSPFVCAPFEETQLKEFSVKKTNASERESITSYPLALPSAKALGDSNQKALFDLLQAYGKAAVSVDTKQGQAVAPVKLNLTDEQAKEVSQSLGTQYLWVATTVGVEVSFAKKFGIAMATAIVSGAATTGNGNYLMPQDGATALVGLIDLNSKEVLWKKSQFAAILPFDKKTFTKEMARELLSPFIPMATTKQQTQF